LRRRDPLHHRLQNLVDTNALRTYHTPQVSALHSTQNTHHVARGYITE
jgi:hypothetical protein